MRTKLGIGWLLLVSAACGSGESDALAKVGWRFDYRDPTDAAVAADTRGCDNAPPVNPGPAYSPIDKVRVLIEDPEGQVPGTDIEHRCALGIGGKMVSIAGLVRQLYTFTLEAKSAAGTVLYRQVKEEFDLGSYSEEIYDLPTATGELHFFPTFAGSFTCPTDVASISYSFYRDGETTPAASGTQSPACEASGATTQSLRLWIRGIPVVLNTSRDSYNIFRMVLEAKNAGGTVLHCAVNPARVVRLGDNSSPVNESLLPGACPP